MDQLSYEAPQPLPDEAQRLEELRLLKILDTASEERFDRFTNLASKFFKVRISLITLVDQDRQWFKSACGTDLTETPREISFCAHAIHEPEIMVVPDLKKDDRFTSNPLVVNEPHVRFYAGAVLRGPTGQPLGTICLVDQQPRAFADSDRAALIQFARMIERELQYEYKIDCVREKAERTAFYDPVTELPNRHLFHDRLTKAIEGTRRTGHRLVVVRADIRNFTALNNAYGSKIGDAVLKECGRRLQEALDPICTVSRWVEDEFVIFVPDLREQIHSERVVRMIHDVFGQPIEIKGGHQVISVRSGASVYPNDGTSPGQLIENAGAALKLCRKDAACEHQFFSKQIREEFLRHLDLEGRLRKAIDQRMLHSVFQPIVDLKTGQISGVEALCRWTDPELGQISPVEFIPIAEQSGLIHSLTMWILENACIQNMAWRKAGRRPIQVSVNVTGSFVERQDFLSIIRSILEKTGMEPKGLRLEVTEGSFVAADSTVVENIKAAQRLGVKFSIDDFGTGYSSFGYLKRLPVDTLKLDRIFVNEITHQRTDATIAYSLISMAHELGLAVIAEGVETEAQLMFLRAYTCEAFQGFYFSPPVSERAIDEMLEEDRKVQL